MANSSRIGCPEQNPRHPPLDQDGVHVWFVDLRASGPSIDRLRCVLSSEEDSRAEKFKFEKDRVSYIVAHAALRHILAGYLELDPSRLEFRRGPFGKPELVLTWHREALQFNLSHSHEAALVAVTLGRQIGVDIEHIKPKFQWEEIAGRFFAPGEVARLRTVPQEQQQRAFFTCWTRKEAYIKAKGGGLSIPLQDFEVSLSPGEPASLLNCANDPEETTRWLLAEIESGPDYAAATAVEGDGWALQYRHWLHEQQAPGI